MLNLFLPTKFHNNFIIRQKIVLMYITEKNFFAMLIHASGNKRKILRQFFFEFENKDSYTDENFMLSLISKSLAGWDFDYVKVILPGSMAIFRSLSFPFSDIEKIKMVIPFELESLLPFQLSEAAIDVLYQNKIQNNESNKVLAVVTKDIYINFYRDIFSKLEIRLQTITIDVVELIVYCLYYFSSTYEKYTVMYQYNNNYVLLYFSGSELISLKYLDTESINETSDRQGGQSPSVVSMIEFFSKEHGLSLQEIPLYYIRFSQEDITIKTIQEKNIFKVIEEIIPNGATNNISVFEEKSDISMIEKNKFFSICSKLLYQNDLFNLEYKENNNPNNTLLFKQLVTVLILSFALYIVLIGANLFKMYELNKFINENEKKIINILKNEFKLANKHTKNVDSAYNECKKIVTELEANLPIPIVYKKFLFISLFANLEKSISTNIKGLSINEVKWKLSNDGGQSTLFFDGKVSDFDSLQLLEENLKKSKLFVAVPQQQDISFSFNLSIAEREKF